LCLLGGGRIIASMNERFASDELIYKGKVLEVHAVGVRMPDGKVVQRDLVRHPGAAVVLPVLQDGSIVLIRNYRFAAREHLYELPAGLLDDGEAPESCAARELTEETGYRAGKIERLGSFFSTPGSSDQLIHAYLATDLSDGRQSLEQYEQITVEVVSDAQVRRMIAEGVIHDGKTVATLGMYWLRKGTV